MPIYKYKCKICNNEFEIFTKTIAVTDTINSDCKICKKITQHKLIISPTVFVLKGNGWAKDNYSNHKE